MHIVICEDDLQYQENIAGMAERWAEERGCAVSIARFSSSEDFLSQWRKGMKCDLLLLDILFYCEMDGICAARTVRETDAEVPIVFITVSDAYIRDGYRIQALRYLSKPVSNEDLSECMDIAYNRYISRQNGFLVLESPGGRYAIPKKEIICIEAFAPRIRIERYGQKEPTELRYRFKNVLSQLNGDPVFVLCHRSILVNLIHIRCVRKPELCLSNGKKLPLSRMHAASVMVAFDRYYQGGGK